MNLRTCFGVLLMGAFVLPACRESEAKIGLPPPTGSGVPAPAVPAVTALMQDPVPGASATGPAALAGTGTLYPEAQAELGPNASGVLRQVLVEQGDRVKKGQVLFRLDSVHAELAVQQAKASLESARVNLRTLELEYRRSKELHEKGSLPAAVFEQVEARYDVAKTSLLQAETALQVAQKALADTIVRSPIDGVVTEKRKNVGEAVTMMPPTTVVVVQDTKRLELRVRLPESVLGTLAPGGTLRAVFPAIGVERVVPILRINPAIDVMTRTVEIVCTVENGDEKLRPGMLAEVKLDAAPPAAASASGGQKGKAL
ncbi:MAG TPA: efflux RND transporter periplasmic adaptor subunit [Polyangiaceae bacterium]|nr:efflux RND transporter periplasmic adaptor subunit [Polyangiaceae bacterium]